mmetsp:Transcript_26721/g.39521  ORF Transcript_26721/g.39521 Transcript_26721/m.39521 type:complete len:184 (-) Transcript_26721:328-879(-)|eukprot:CAMPEP_0194226164 /NCGR_PEP_ID=MMETSP0156-20130528/41290_1 /TAXON_ID=33649 /ORGANISM="Thalassionema nitzschioides, Strain L26-B" /LENGTH=183 /DNA_ID=CAMNT_0038958425 /DNA_START=114 /DNA_END=665 /DNA_ORIENTATION=+
MTRKMPIRYDGKIETSGQCRGNLKTWGGIWRLGLSCQPQWEQDSEDDVSRVQNDELHPCYAVLTHRKNSKCPRETRFFGKASLTYLCGDATFLDVNWLFRKEDVPYYVDLGSTPDDLEADLWEYVSDINNPDFWNSSNELECTVANSTFLFRGTYLLMGNTGSHENDNCIRLSVVDGHAAISG